jgi:hypothetical protein
MTPSSARRAARIPARPAPAGWWTHSTEQPNFVYGRPDHAVSVGVETNGVITAGAIIRVSDGRR